ncbi:MAG: hypothetical protein LBL37_02145, partial [Gracilibacteraceae bacterium]|nr:hypothetical protein [Gracilibacteraceae bacterium]
MKTKKLVTLFVAAILAFGLIAAPVFASIPGNYFYVYDSDTEDWIEAPMGQDTVYGYSLDPVTGYVTVLFGIGEYTIPDTPIVLLGKIVSVVIDGEEALNADDTIVFPPTATDYITLDELGIDMTFADYPDWNDPIIHVPLY